jgi:hypothetical protein
MTIGYIEGTGVIRDKDGNIKSEFKLQSVPMTEQEAKEATEKLFKGVDKDGDIPR